MFVKENLDKKKIHPADVERMLFSLLFCVFQYHIEIFFVISEKNLISQYQNTHDEP